MRKWKRFLSGKFSPGNRDRNVSFIFFSTMFFFYLQYKGNRLILKKSMGLLSWDIGMPGYYAGNILFCRKN